MMKPRTVAISREKSRMGRPPKYEGARLSKNRTFRILDGLDAKLQAAAAESGRSVSEEIAYRLERSFTDAEIREQAFATAWRAKPRAVATSRYEGGEWVEFVPHVRPETRLGHQVHAIKFEDGSVWDAYNGWRTERDAERSYSHWGIHG